MKVANHLPWSRIGHLLSSQIEQLVGRAYRVDGGEREILNRELEQELQARRHEQLQRRRRLVLRGSLWFGVEFSGSRVAPGG